ncbi:glycosyltransferase [Hydrotalea sp.]|uniref:glycosyltransferase n=1 Tax=Hydrotalea sp. TaxID=2881279 RepID=UPI002618D9ED|nr:glycosyltransferase [Hydrotalea sp.]
MKNKPVVFIVCTGVGHIRRGYESFTEECFAALKDAQGFKMYLLKGGGKSEKQAFRIPCVQRNTGLSKKIATWMRTEAYFVEQFSFLLAMMPLVIWYRPSVIYYSDFKLGTWLWQLRRFFKFRYKLLFANGAPNGPPFTRMDHVQQLLPLYIEQACAGGTAMEKQTLLPYAININEEAITAMFRNKVEWRKRLGLPAAMKVMISVGAVNSHHKRMDYVIREFALLPASDFFLVLLGQTDADSQGIINLANELLPQHNFIIQQVSSEQVRQYMCVADYFILASLSEGLPRVLPEALSTGLFPIVHDYAVTRQTLGSYGVYRDLQQNGQLVHAIAVVDHMGIKRAEFLNYAIKTYSWDTLLPQYEKMIVQLISNNEV